MAPRLAIAVIHGIGRANPGFADPRSPRFTEGLAQGLHRAFARRAGLSVGQAREALAIEPVYWAPVLEERQDCLDQRLGIKRRLSACFGVRQFVFHQLSDSIGYQLAAGDRTLYDSIHHCFAQSLERLVARTSDRAPLCVMAHSLGSTIASNYLWDLQQHLNRVPVGPSALAQGQTLALFYTFGSQLPFWAMRHRDFGTPIAVPSPLLGRHYPGLAGEWVNFYDRHDLLGYPLRDINLQYSQVVVDQPVRAGNWLTQWTPLCHSGYWKSPQMLDRMAQGLVAVWRSAQGWEKAQSRSYGASVSPSRR
jgi:hypothetical protein